MSIITTAPAVPSRLLTLFATLSEHDNGLKRDALVAYATPPSLASRGGSENSDASSSLLTNSLQEAKRLGLVEEIDDKLHVGSGVAEYKSQKYAPEETLRLYLLDLLFDEVSAEKAANKGFALALAWFLSRNPLSPLDFGQAPQEIIRNDIGEVSNDTELTNLNRYQNFLYWARFFGFAIIVGSESGRNVIPEPSRAIRNRLPTILEKKGTWMDIDDFVEELGRELPVLEDGWARDFIEKARSEPSNDGDNLSVSTSFALRRLKEDGLIEMESVADARARILNYGSRTERVSRLRRKGV